MALDLSAENERRTWLAALLEQASEAHAQYETVILRHADPNWPRWLAGFALDRSMNKLIKAHFSEDQLAELLKRYEADYQSQGANGSRPEYYAQRLLADVL